MYDFCFFVLFLSVSLFLSLFSFRSLYIWYGLFCFTTLHYKLLIERLRLSIKCIDVKWMYIFSSTILVVLFFPYTLFFSCNNVIVKLTINRTNYILSAILCTIQLNFWPLSYKLQTELTICDNKKMGTNNGKLAHITHTHGAFVFIFTVSFIFLNRFDCLCVFLLLTNTKTNEFIGIDWRRWQQTNRKFNFY